MRHTGFTYEECNDRPAATGYQRLPGPLTPVLRNLLPAGITGQRYGRYVAYRPFYVDGAAYGGLVGGADDVARLAVLHLGGGAVDGVRVLSPEAVAQMQRIAPSGGRYDFGLGWYRPRGHHDFVEHLGGGSGFFTVLRLYPEERLGVVLMGNTTRYDHDSIIDAIRRWSVPTIWSGGGDQA
jgi:CubicO group peptidase (beta-lactamase class C family)